MLHPSAKVCDNSSSFCIFLNRGFKKIYRSLKSKYLEHERKHFSLYELLATLSISFRVPLHGDDNYTCFRLNTVCYEKDQGSDYWLTNIAVRLQSRLLEA